MLRRVLVPLAVAVLAASVWLSAAAGAAAKGPTGSQIRAAVRRAEHSSELWSTVNVCNTALHPNTIGVRGQMPALGFTTRLYMGTQIEYWSTSERRYKPAHGADAALRSIGLATRGLHQAGVLFPFAPPAAGVRYLLRGVVTLEWKLAGKLLGKVVRKTGHGYSNVDQADPPHYSAGTCTIG